MKTLSTALFISLVPVRHLCIFRIDLHAEPCYVPALKILARPNRPIAANLTSRKLYNILKILIFKWRPFCFIRMECWNVGIVEYWVLELNKSFYKKRQNTF